MIIFRLIWRITFDAGESMNEISQQLIFHGSVILLLGLIAGAPYARAILKKRSKDTIHIWRMAHLALPIAAILLFAIASFIPTLEVSSQTQWMIAILLIASSYAFGFAMFVGAQAGERGLTFRGPMIAKVAHLGHMVGVLT